MAKKEGNQRSESRHQGSMRKDIQQCATGWDFDDHIIETNTHAYPSTHGYSNAGLIQHEPKPATGSSLNDLFEFYGIPHPTSGRHREREDEAEWGMLSVGGDLLLPPPPKDVKRRTEMGIMQVDQDVRDMSGSKIVQETWRKSNQTSTTTQESRKLKQEHAWATEQRRRAQATNNYTRALSPSIISTHNQDIFTTAPSPLPAPQSVSQANLGQDTRPHREDYDFAATCLHDFRAAMVPIYQQHMRTVNEISTNLYRTEEEKKRLLRHEERKYQGRILEVKDTTGYNVSLLFSINADEFEKDGNR